MRLRSIALALSLAFCATSLAEAAKKPAVVKHKSSKAKSRTVKPSKAQKQAKKFLAKRRKQHA